MAVLRNLLYLLLGLAVALAPLQAQGRQLAIGAPLKGAWVSPDMPGQGFLIEIIDGQAVLFMAWFTYPRPADGVITDPVAHRWYTIEGAIDGNEVDATIFQTTGGNFLGPEPTVADAIGSATVSFSTCNSGVIDYRFNDSGEAGTININRAIAVGESHCTSLVEAGALPDIAGHNGPVAFWNVTLLDMPSGQPISGQMVVVNDDSITHVGPVDLAMLPGAAALIDGHGKFLLPGLVDTHTHLATNVREYSGLNVHPSVVEVSAGTQMILYLARGVTTILNEGDFGEPLPRWGEEVIAGERVGPTIYAAKYARGSSATPDGGPAGVEIFNADQARTFTQQAAADGYQFMKVYNWTPRDGVLAIIDEGSKLGLPVIGHFPQTMGAQEALEAGMVMVGHSGAFLWRWFGNSLQAGPALQDQVVQATLNTGASVTATAWIEEMIAQIWCQDLAGVAAYWARPETRYMHPTTRNLNDRSIKATWRWSPEGCSPGGYQAVTDFVLQFTRRLHEGGVRLLMGTDSPTVLGMPGFSAADEMQSLVNAGIPLLDALRIATWNGGQFISGMLNLDQPFGAIREGWRADLLLLNADPLASPASLRDITGVMGRGRWKSSAWFDERLEEIAELYGN